MRAAAKFYEIMFFSQFVHLNRNYPRKNLQLLRKYKADNIRLKKKGEKKT